MNRNQAAGHLGAANNPTVSAEAKHYSRQQLISAGHKSSGISKQKIAGWIGATTNPQLSQQSQHEARKAVMDAVCPDVDDSDRSSRTSRCSSQTSRCSSQASRSSSRTSNCSFQTPYGQDGHYDDDSDHLESDDDYSDY
jgi:hypothetical protein